MQLRIAWIGHNLRHLVQRNVDNALKSAMVSFLEQQAVQARDAPTHNGHTFTTAGAGAAAAAKVVTEHIVCNLQMSSCCNVSVLTLVTSSMQISFRQALCAFSRPCLQHKMLAVRLYL